MRKLLFLGILTLATAGYAAGAEAQSKRYDAWKPPEPLGEQQSSSGEMGEFVKELQTLLRAAKRDNAANPRFLRDIERLIAKYNNTNPWGDVVLRDHFQDGNFTQNPTWRVLQGKFWVENGYGLRSRVRNKRFAREMTEEEQTQALVSVILGAATGTKPALPDAGDDEPAAIVVPVKIPNNFVTEIEFKSHEPGGHLEFGVYQVGRASSGYRLIYRPGLRLRLVKVGSSGIKVIARSKGRLRLEDGKAHTLRITRVRGGLMAIAVDDKRLLTFTDNSFRDPFDGFSLVNRAGDFSVSRVVAVAGR